MTGERLILRIVGPLAFVALAACGTATTQTSTTDHAAELATNTAYFAADFSCTHASVQDIDLKLLNATPDRYTEKCIRLNAFTDGRSLYPNAFSMISGQGARLSVGLYWKDDNMQHHLNHGPSFVTITGRLRDCAKHNTMTAQAALITSAPGAVPAQPAILGACKTATTAIFISDVQIVPTAMD